MWSISSLAPWAAAASSFSVARGHGGDPGAEVDAELDGGEADPAAGAEHDQLLPRLDLGHRTEHVVGGAVGHAEGGRRRVGHPVGRRRQGGLGDHDLLGEGAHERGAEDPGPVVPLAGELAAGDERQRGGHLVLVGHHEHVGEVDRCGADPDPDLARPGLGRRELVDLDHLGRAVRAADRGAHRCLR